MSRFEHNHWDGTRNTLKDVGRSHAPFQPITLSMCSLTATGAAAAVVTSDAGSQPPAIRARAVRIAAQHMVTDLPSSFGRSLMNLCGVEMAAKAAELCYGTSGLSADDIDVVEVHDCFAPNELFMYESMQLAPKGKGAELVRNGVWVDNGNGGRVFKMRKWVVNPSGGLENKGHPIGATGLAQCYELVTQLRNEAGNRQVPNAKRALQHNFGIGGAAVVTIYEQLPSVQSKL